MSLCYGVVKDFESMVPSQWWKTVFDSWYLKTDGDVVEDPEITLAEIQLLLSKQEIKQAVEAENAKLLDLCCGQGRHSLLLQEIVDTLKVYGHDQSEYLINVAKERRGNENKYPVFTVGDCRKIPYSDAFFDIVLIMGNSFGYFDVDEGDSYVLAEVRRVLKPGGIIVLDLTNGAYMKKSFSPRSWEWIDNETFVCRERALSKDQKRLMSREVISHTLKGVIRDQFYQERLYTDTEMVDLLKEKKFIRCQVLNTEVGIDKEMSKRNQDLGMMEYRMILMAKKLEAFEDEISSLEDDKSEQLVGNKTLLNPFVFNDVRFSKLIILLGDPKMKCVGKLNNSWNENDFFTVDQLKSALAKNYSEKTLLFLDNHDRMSSQIGQEISKSRNVLFLNFCDEGFENVATQEMFVPCILEMHKAKYTGANHSSLVICYDKQIVNQTARAIGVPVAFEIFVDKEAVHNLSVEDLKYPLFVKPCLGDNSLGIFNSNIVHNGKELLKVVYQLLFEMGFESLLIQEYLPGAEYSIGVIGNPEFSLLYLPIIEVDFSKIEAKNLPPILNFESKWDPESPYWTDIGYKQVNNPSICEPLKNYAKRLFTRFGCRDYARFDFRMDAHGTLKLLEVNPNPGWCYDGKMSKMVQAAGLEYSDLLKMVVNAAQIRLFPEEK